MRDQLSLRISPPQGLFSLSNGASQNHVIVAGEASLAPTYLISRRGRACPARLVIINSTRFVGSLASQFQP